MRNLKKTLSLFLALSMVFSMVCTTAFADEGPETVRPLGDDVLGSAQNEAPPTAGSEEDEAPQPEVTEEPKAEEPKAEEPKAEEPKTEEPKTEEPKAEEPKAEEPKAEEPKAEEPKAEEPKAEEPKAEEPKAEEPKAEEPKAEEPKAEEPKAEEPKAEEPKAEEPKAPITAEELVTALPEVITEVISQQFQTAASSLLGKEPQVPDPDPAVTAFLADMMTASAAMEDLDLTDDAAADAFIATVNGIVAKYTALTDEQKAALDEYGVAATIEELQNQAAALADATVSNTMTGANLLAKADANGVITLDGDVTLTSKMSVSKDITLELNGYTVTATSADSYFNTIEVYSGKTLTIKDSVGGGKITDSGLTGSGFSAEGLILTKGTLNLLGGTIEATKTNCVRVGANSTGGMVILDGAALVCTASGKSGIDIYQNATNAATAVINSGSITAEKYGLQVGNKRSATMNGGTITVRGVQGVGVFKNGQGGDVKLLGGTINATGVQGVGVHINGESNVTLSNIEINVLKYNGIHLNGAKTKVEISGDTKITASRAINMNTGWWNSAESSLTVTGGNLNGNLGTLRSDPKAEISISGGTFTADVTPYVAEGKAQDASGQVLPEEQVTVPMGSVAQVGEVYYRDLQAAIAVANANADVSTITILKDCDFVNRDQAGNFLESAKIKTKVILDLNGFAVTTKDANGANGRLGMWIVADGDLTIRDSSTAQTGKFICDPSSGGNAIDVDGGKFTLESGTIESNNNGILVDGENDKNVVKILGGKIVCDSATADSSVFYIVRSANVTISSGEMSGYHGARMFWDDISLEMTGGSITATAGEGIVCNGTCSGTDIALSGDAYVNGAETAIYHPQKGTLKISGNVTLEGETGVIVKGGTVSISGGTITGTGEAGAYRPESSGAASTGDALYVENYGSGYGTPTVTITGGTFISTNAKAVGNYANTDGGMAPLTSFISGGTFSTDVTAYCAEGYVAHPVSGSENYNVHSNATSYAHDETNHWTVCTACGKVAEGTTAAHTFGDWVTDTAAQVGVAGSRHHDCVCGYSVTETIPALPGGGGGGGSSSSGSGSSSSGGGSSSSGGGTVEIDDPDVPLADLPLPFTDVKDSDWYREAVAYVYGNDLMRGVDGSLFGANTNTTRGMMATIIYRLEKEPETAFEKIFSDVENGKWYSEAIAWGSKNEVVLGYDNGDFGPDDSVTREQLVVMLYRYAVKKGLDMSKKADLSAFADAAQVSGYAKDAMGWAVQNGIIKGRGSNTLAPGGLALRVEVAAIFQRFAALYETLV